MERKPESEVQAQESWRTALLAPLRRRLARTEEAAAGEDTAATPATEATALSGDQPARVKTTAEVARFEEEHQRALGRVAVSKVLANVYHDPSRHTVTLLLDEQHATAVIYAIRVLAADYEAHAREVRAVAATLPPNSYGAANRLYIAIRHERIASRLRRVESRYRAEISEGGLPAD